MPSSDELIRRQRAIDDEPRQRERREEHRQMERMVSAIERQADHMLRLSEAIEAQGDLIRRLLQQGKGREWPSPGGHWKEPAVGASERPHQDHYKKPKRTRRKKI